MAVTPRPQVLDSAEFVAHEYDRELFERRVYADDVEGDMYLAATRLVRRGLETYWGERGYLVLGVNQFTYHRITEEDNAEMRVGSVLIPSADDAARAWDTVVADITADDIEEEARRA